MNSETYIPVAKLGKPHGVSGAFRFYLLRPLKHSRKRPPYFLISTKGEYVPYFVASLEWLKPDEGLLRFEDITTPEHAKNYSGNTLYMTDKDVKLFFADTVEDVDYLIGYILIDKQKGKLGHIDSLTESPGQILAMVEGSEKEYIIPLADDWIVKVNTRKKEILMDLPDGLLDL